MTIYFKTHENTIKTFTNAELDYLLLQLNSYNQYYNQYYQGSNDDIAFIKTSQNTLIIIDLGYTQI